MLYNSYIFLLFLPLVLIAFYLAMGKLGRNYALATLALASFIFYGWWELAYVPLLFLSALGNFLIGRRIQASRSASAQQQKLILIVGLSGNLGLLAYYKYAGFFAGFLQALGGGGLDFSEVVLPLAISFFTFQQIAYLMDLSRGDEVRYSFLEYLVFVTFFPQLIAGPIVHHREMMPQLQGLGPSDQTLTNLAVGFSLFILGLGKKVLLADNFSGLADASFALADSGIAQGSTGAWMGSLAYSLQIYFDFSGYSDMALGLGMLFGVRLPANFNSPYKASNIIDFWRRWHITLSRFLRDYLYIPLGGNRRGRRDHVCTLGSTARPVPVC
jgi:D-alanyl-lipoteichoic acid acyltransferase DltB (MBOAT superfamily)